MKATKRFMAFFLALIMVISPLSVYAETNAANGVNTYAANGYNEKLFAEMVSLYEGDAAKARLVLDTLYANGLIDSEGNIDFGETFVVDGVEVTKDELRELTAAASSDDSVNIDGTDMTWATMKQMFATLDALALIEECEESDVVLTEEHITALKSFAEKFANGELTITGSKDENGIGIANTSIGISPMAGSLTGVSVWFRYIDGKLTFHENYNNDKEANDKGLYAAEYGLQADSEIQIPLDTLGVTPPTGSSTSCNGIFNLDDPDPVYDFDPVISVDGGHEGNITFTLTRAVDFDVPIEFTYWGAGALSKSGTPGGDIITYTIPKGETSITVSPGTDRVLHENGSWKGRLHITGTLYSPTLRFDWGYKHWQFSAITRYHGNSTDAAIMGAGKTDNATLVPTFHVPEGNYYPSEVVPIVMKLDTPIEIGNPGGLPGEYGYNMPVETNNVQIVVNGMTLSPQDGSTNHAIPSSSQYYYHVKSDTFTYYYPVQENDRFYPTIEEVKLNGAPKTVSGKTVTWNSNNFTPVSLTNTRLIAPNKTAVFDVDNRTFLQKADGTSTLRIPLVDDIEKLTWLAANAAQDDNGDWYVKGMYGSSDGGATRVPLYIEVANENFTYTDPLTGIEATVSEKPVAITAEFPMGVNLGAAYKISTFKIYMEPEITDTDFIKNPDLYAPEIPDHAFRFAYFSAPTVFLAQNNIAIEYNAAWKALADQGSNTISQVFDSALAKAGAALSYTISGNSDYTYIAPSNFVWESSDPDVATVITTTESYMYKGKDVGRIKATIVPTGVGEVKFKLTAKNGGGANTLIYESASITIEESPDYYFLIPELSKEVVALRNEAVDLYFLTNITSVNAAGDPDVETDITLKLYKLDTNGEPEEAAVETIVQKSTLENRAVKITIPENVLDITSSSGGFSYKAEISVTATAMGEILTDDSLIKVKSAPIKIQLSGVSNEYVLDNADMDISWNIYNVDENSSSKHWYYVVTRKSDNEEIYSSNASSSFNTANMNVSLDLDGVLKIPQGTLKEIYNVSVYAQNNQEDGYAVDSMLVYVYNSTALDILVNPKSNMTVSGDRVDFDNEPYVQDVLSKGTDSRVLDLEAAGLTMAQLRSDLDLSAIISINYGEYVWGLLSDQIEWEVTEDSTADTAINYSQAGGWSDIEYGYYPSYLPITNFLMTTTKAGDYTIKATHARTGMYSEIEGTVETLKDKLYLFQAQPAIKCKLSYYNKSGQKVELETDDNGSIAIYEPDGIHSDVSFMNLDTKFYLGTRKLGELLTSERNIAQLQVYPMNNVRLVEAGTVTVYLTKPDGSKLTNTDVTVRGGVWWNGNYAKYADLQKGYLIPDTEYLDHSSGLHDQAFKTDQNGRLTIYFNPSQFPDAGIDLDPGDTIKYAFELRFEDANGKAIYKPEVFETETGVAGNNHVSTQISLLANNSKDNKVQTFIKSRSMGMYENNKLFETINLTNGGPSTVGASEKFDKVIMNTRTFLWGYEVDVDPVTHQSVLNGNDNFSVLFRNKATGEPLDGQNENVYVYPFSTFAISEASYTMDVNSYGGTKTGDVYDWTNAWLPAQSEAAVETIISKNGVQSQIWPVSFKIINTLGKQEAVKSPQLNQEAVRSVTDNMDFDIDKILGNLVPGGDMLAKGMAFFSGIATGGDYTIELTMVPTADPTIFNIILAVGEQDSNIDDDQGDTDGVSADYANSMNTKDLQEAFGSADDSEGEEGMDDDSAVEFKFFGSMIARATYNITNDTWDIMMTGGEIGAKVGVKKEYSQNFVIACVPVTLSFSAEAFIRASFGAKTQYVNGGEEFATLISIKLGAGIEAFAGVGFDYSIIALKLGIYGNIGFETTQKIMVKYNGSMQQGQKLAIKGEVGIKFIAKILCFKYEKTFASTGFGWSKTWNQYDAIESYWQGRTRSGQPYSATVFSGGETMFTLESYGLEDRDYLDVYSRTWISNASLNTFGAQGWFSSLQTNAYPYSNPQFSEDGQIIVYISDADNTDIDETVVSWAKWNGSGYTDMGAIAKLPETSKEAYGYGDSNLSISGSNGKYFATWVQQTETSSLIEDEESEGQEVSNEDLSVMMRSTEIMAAYYDGSKWNAERLTDNNGPDLAPVIASNSKGEAMVFWRSTYSSSSENPLDFNVEDTILYKRFNGTSWTNNSAVAYNGSNGSVKGIGAAMGENGAGVVTFSVKTGAEEDSTDFETFYSYIQKGEVDEKGINPLNDVMETVRVSSNDIIDENVQIVSVKQGGKDAFVLGWYTEDEDGKSDIKLLVIRDDGSLDTTFPESISAVGELNASNTFRFSIPKSGDVSDLAIAWVEKLKSVSGDEEVTIDTLQGVKLFNYAEKYGITAPQQIAVADLSETIDYFDVYSDGDTVNAVVSITDYSNAYYDLVGQINIRDIVNGIVKWENYETEEAYQEAWDAEYEKQVEENPDTLLDIYSASGETILAQASYTFKNAIEVTSVSYDKEGVFAEAILGVNYIVKNMGITPISKITVWGGASNNEKIKEVTLTVALLPGESAGLMAEYQIGADIKDIPYKISGTLSSTQVNVDATGAVEINRPDIEIYSMEVVREENGIRDVNVRLFNNSSIPLAGSNKTVEVGFYLDSDYTQPLTKSGSPVTLTILASNTDAMTMIDNGGYIHQLNVDMTEVLTALSVGAEIPESGVTLYAKAALYNNYGTQSQAQQLEDRRANNKETVVLESLIKKADGEALSFLNTIITENDDDSLTVEMDVSNNSMVANEVGNVLIELLDAEGNVLISKQTFDLSKSVEDNTMHLGKEAIQPNEITFTADEIAGIADKVVAARSSVYSNDAQVSVRFDTGGLGDEIPEQVINFGGNVEEPEDPVVPIYEFKGWYKDAAFTQSFDFDTDVATSDMVLYANFEVTIYAEVSDVTVSGERMSDITETDVVFNITNANFGGLNVGNDVSAYFTNLPAGLTATVKSLANDNKTLTVSISGKPTAKALATKMTFAIPFDKVTTESEVANKPTNLVVKANENAGYNIIGTVLSLNEAVQIFTYTGKTKAFVIKELNSHTTTDYTVKYQKNGSDVTPINSGSYDVVITRAEDNDYSAYSTTIIGGLVINKDEVAITVVATPASTVYENDVTITAKVTGVTPPTGKVQFYIDGAKEGNEQFIDALGLTSMTIVSPAAVTYTYKAEYLGDDNFNTKMSAESEFSVDKASFESGTDYSTSGVTETFNGEEHSITVDVFNKAQNALVEYSTDEVNYSSTPITYRDVGVYTVHYRITMDNWNEVNGSEQVIINQRVADLEWSGYDKKVYDDTASNVVAVVTNMADGDTVEVTIENGTQTDAGTYTATATALSDSNYILPEEVTMDYEITKRPVTITVDAAEKMVNTPDPDEFTFTIDGAIPGSDDIVVTLSRIEGEFAGNYAIVGTFNDNYEVTFMGNYLTIKNQANDPLPALYSVSGTVTNSGTGSDDDVIVTIMQGNKVFGTSAGMSYSFANLAAGAYNITATNGTESKTVYIELSANTTEHITIGTQFAEIIVEGDETPPVVASVEALENILRDNPSITSLQLVVDMKDAPSEISALAASAGKAIALNLDFTVVENTIPQTTYEFDDLITVKFPIPDVARGKLITVYRLHDGKAEAMPTTPNTDGEYVEIGTDMITLYIKKFSDYAVGYSSAKITASAGRGGTISPTDIVEVTVGDSKTFSITPNGGYSISDVKVDGVSVGKVSTYTFENVNANHTISATFLYNSSGDDGNFSGGSGGGGGATYYNVTINKDGVGTGSVTANPARSAYGDTVIITVKPDAGYALDKLTITDSSGKAVSFTENNDGTYTYKQPSSNVTVVATFIKDSTTDPVVTEPVTPDVVKPDDSDVSALLNTIKHMAYVSGIGNNMFAPDANMTRAEAAQMFYNLLLDKNVAITKSFADVSDNAWYAKAVNTLASLGIISGFTDGGFHPNDKITRAQFATIVVRFAKISTGDTRFTDVPATHWAYDYINTAANLGWVSGVGGGKFDPDRNITRAEAVTIINRMLRREANDEHIHNSTNLIRFSDVDRSHWAYYQIMEASNDHD